jgi:hypothetical protein
LSIFQQKIGKFLNFFVPPNNSNNSNNWGGGGYFHPKKLYEKIGGKNTYP